VTPTAPSIEVYPVGTEMFPPGTDGPRSATTRPPRGATATHATVGVPTTPGRLAGLPVLVAHGDTDTVIPWDERTWTYLHGGADRAR
jgi:hypothetical protein